MLRGLKLRRIAGFLLAEGFWAVMTLALFMTVGIVLGVVAVQFDATRPEGWMPAGLAMALVIVLFCFGLMGPRILVDGIWSVVTAARTIEAHFRRALVLVLVGAGPLVGLNEHVNGYVALVAHDHGALSGNGVMGAEGVVRACLASVLSMTSTVVLWVALTKLYLTTEPVTRITRHRPVKPEIFD